MIRNDAIAKLILEIAEERATNVGDGPISFTTVRGFQAIACARGFALTDECVAGALEDLHNATLLLRCDDRLLAPAYRISPNGRAHLAATTAEVNPVPTPEPPKPFFTSFVSEAALDGWWDSCDTEIKVELFNHFFESVTGRDSAEEEY